MTDLGKHPSGVLTAATLSSALGLVVYPGDVPTGGVVGLRITSCADLQCQSLDFSPDQAVVGVGTKRSWYWKLIPQQPGPAFIVLSAVIYDGFRGPALSQEVIPIKVNIHPTASFNRARSAKQLGRATGFINTIAGLIVTISGAVSAIVGLIVAAVKLLKRFRRKKAEERARSETERQRREEEERRLEIASQRREEAEKLATERLEAVERQKQDPAWRRPQRPTGDLIGQLLVSVRWLLVLWDVDHTLIENNGVNKETYAKAFELLTGLQAEHQAETDGRTEPEILRNMLIAHGLEVPNNYSARVVEVLETATESNASRLRERGHELPGARDALIALKGMPGIVQSILSGNTRPNAYTKLSAFGLDEYLDFEVGGYGSDGDVRANLVGVAQRRASAKYGVSFGPAITVLVGDTPRDVRAGLDGGAHVVGVASGSDGVDTLREAGADVVLPDLRDTQAVVRAVTQFQGRTA